MALEIRRPWWGMAPWRQLDERMDRLFEETVGQSGRQTPPVELFERAGTLVLRAELPGLKREEISVEVADHTLTIAGERKAEQAVEERHDYRCERSYGSFQRSITLPAGVEPGQIAATFQDGILEVTLPKATGPAATKVAIH